MEAKTLKICEVLGVKVGERFRAFDGRGGFLSGGDVMFVNGEGQLLTDGGMTARGEAVCGALNLGSACVCRGMTEGEVAACRIMGARYATLDEDEERYVEFWSDRPKRMAEPGMGRYWSGEDAAELLGTVACKASNFGMRCGECAEVPKSGVPAPSLERAEGCEEDPPICSLLGVGMYEGFSPKSQPDCNFYVNADGLLVRCSYGTEWAAEGWLVCDLVSGNEEILYTPPVTGWEAAILRELEAKYASLDAGHQYGEPRRVRIWSARPGRTRTREGTYYASDANGSYLGELPPEKFPSICPGQCVSLDDGAFREVGE